MVSLELQTVASKLALEFNSRHKRVDDSGFTIKFLMSKIARFVPARVGQPFRYMMFEKQFQGDCHMVKYTNNYDYVCPQAKDVPDFETKRDLVVCFAHFTLDVTDGYLLVCDLQGIDSKSHGKRDTILLTAIHCAKAHALWQDQPAAKGNRGLQGHAQVQPPLLRPGPDALWIIG